MVTEQLQLQKDINTLIRWSEEWQMLFNTSKCRVMHWGRSNHHAEYQMNNQKLEVTAEKRI